MCHSYYELKAKNYKQKLYFQVGVLTELQRFADVSILAVENAQIYLKHYLRTRFIKRKKILILIVGSPKLSKLHFQLQ